MDRELKNFIKVWTLATTALLYCHFIASRIPKGTLRLISILPVVYLFIILPLHLTSFHFCSVTFVILLCLGNFKLLLFSFDEGPLSPPPRNALLFIAIACLPIKLELGQPNTKTKTTTNPPNYSITSFFSFGVKLLFLALSLYIFVNYKSLLHPLVLLLLCGCLLYCELNIALAISEVVARAILGFEIEPLHNHPYLSTSLQDFWGRRYNLIINNVLSTIIYKPIRSVSTPAIGSKCASFVAILVTFSVSGLMHEVLFFYHTRVNPTWEVTWFFVLHGVFVAAEVAVKRVMKDRWRLHPVVSGSFTMAFLAVTGFWLFFHQVKRDELDEKIIGECSILVTFFSDKIKNLINRSENQLC